MLAIGRTDLAEDPQLANNAGRDARASEIYGVIDDWVAANDAQTVLQLAASANVPATSIYSVADMFADPQFQFRQMIETAVLPDGKPFRVPGIVPKLSATPGQLHAIGPALGAHTDEILETIGYRAEEIDLLRRNLVI